MVADPSLLNGLMVLVFWSQDFFTGLSTSSSNSGGGGCDDLNCKTAVENFL